MKYIYIKYKDGHSSTCDAHIIRLDNDSLFFIDEMLHVLEIPMENVEAVTVRME